MDVVLIEDIEVITFAGHVCSCLASYTAMKR